MKKKIDFFVHWSHSGQIVSWKASILKKKIRLLPSVFFFPFFFLFCLFRWPMELRLIIIIKIKICKYVGYACCLSIWKNGFLLWVISFLSFLTKIITMIGMSLPLLSLYGTVCSSCPFLRCMAELKHAQTVWGKGNQSDCVKTLRKYW